MKDFKYLFAFTIPLSAYASLASVGVWTYSSVFYAFLALPILDLISGESKENLTKEEVSHKRNEWIFNLMLYLNVPIVFGLLYVVFVKIHQHDYETYELVGLALSSGILLATNGINVAHELGHRPTPLERLLSKLLYMPCLYMHFFIEHNFGHHLNVATPEDGATARYNQTIYSFWFTSVTRQYVSAWKIQMKLLKGQQAPFLSIKNEMLVYHIIQPTYLIGLYGLFSLKVMLFALLIGVIAFLFLECINYVEHYGLLRTKNESGKYEQVQIHHSWNSDFNIGRITLYELTRHSDHHHRASKKYQVLNSYNESPTLPVGYPAAILLSFIPPLWFWVMNPRVPEAMKPHTEDA